MSKKLVRGEQFEKISLVQLKQIAKYKFCTELSVDEFHSYSFIF